MCGIYVWSVFGNAILSVHFSFDIIVLRKRELDAIIYLSSCGHMAVSVFGLFIAVLWVGL